MRRTPVALAAVILLGCGGGTAKDDTPVSPDDPLADLGPAERDAICRPVPREEAVCDTASVARDVDECLVVLASVTSSCEVTVGEFENAVARPVCAYLDQLDAWSECFGGTNTPTNIEPNVEPNGSPNEDTADFDPQFVQVANIIRTNCALAGCHGMGSGAVHTYVTGTNATLAEVQAGLSTPLPVPGTGNVLIAPGAPQMSEIYIRITKPLGDPILMGQGTYGAVAVPLEPDDIGTIEEWISAGAIYRR